MRVAVITCYKQPDYMRAVVLRQALALNHEVIIIKNAHINVLRYPEVFLKVLWVRLTQHPDWYILTFRGYEMLLPVGVITWPKPLIFDELINPLEWLNEPRPEKWVRFIPKELLRKVYKFLLTRVRFVLADTSAHADYSARLTYQDKLTNKFEVIPVGADETTFKPGKTAVKKTEYFRVLYYGNMLPLHGLENVLKAAVKIKKYPIEFVIVGGKSKIEQAVILAQADGAKIIYKKWVEMNKLPAEISKAQLCLAGPFGNTIQAGKVITGKAYQSLATGVATLLGDNGANSAFTNKQNCLIVPLGDANALAKTIIWAYEHPQDTKKIGKKGYELYKKSFSTKVIARQLDELLA